jgi:hypothetical protein
MCAAEAEQESTKLHSEGKPVSMAKIALAMRKELDRDYLLKGIPDDLWQKVKLYADVHRTTIKDLIISALKEIVK